MTLLVVFAVEKYVWLGISHVGLVLLSLSLSMLARLNKAMSKRKWYSLRERSSRASLRALLLYTAAKLLPHRCYFIPTPA